MIDRILKGWNFTRVLYLVMGIIFLAQSVEDLFWPGILIGGYFASMGIFAFGCAGGNCYVPGDRMNEVRTEDVDFEEVK